MSTCTFISVYCVVVLLSNMTFASFLYFLELYQLAFATIRPGQSNHHIYASTVYTAAHFSAQRGRGHVSSPWRGARRARAGGRQLPHVRCLRVPGRGLAGVAPLERGELPVHHGETRGRGRGGGGCRHAHLLDVHLAGLDHLHLDGVLSPSLAQQLALHQTVKMGAVNKPWRSFTITEKTPNGTSSTMLISK